MFDFIKKNKKEETEAPNDVIGINEEVMDYNEKEVLDMTHIIEQLDYMNTYLAQILMTQRELLKQQTVANGLNLLNHQYEHADSFMSVNEIQEKYLALAGEIFVDYMQEPENLNNLEEKD